MPRQTSSEAILAKLSTAKQDQKSIFASETSQEGYSDTCFAGATSQSTAYTSISLPVTTIYSPQSLDRLCHYNTAQLVSRLRGARKTFNQYDLSSRTLSYSYSNLADYEQHYGQREIIYKASDMPVPAQVPSTKNNSKIYLFLDLDETLLHSVMLPGNTTFFTMIRPFATKFIEILGSLENVELVLWTAGVENYVISALRFIDPMQHIKQVICRPIGEKDCNFSKCGSPVHQHSKNISMLPEYFHDKSLLIDNSPSVVRDCINSCILVKDFLPQSPIDPNFINDFSLLQILYVILGSLFSGKTKLTATDILRLAFEHQLVLQYNFRPDTTDNPHISNEVRQLMLINHDIHDCTLKHVKDYLKIYAEDVSKSYLPKPYIPAPVNSNSCTFSPIGWLRNKLNKEQKPKPWSLLQQPIMIRNSGI